MESEAMYWPKFGPQNPLDRRAYLEKKNFFAYMNDMGKLSKSIGM